MVILKNKRFMSAMIALILVCSSCLVVASVSNEAGAISAICRKSEECMAAVAKEEEANRNAETATRTANAYRIKVNELSAEIAAKEVEIAENTALMEDLKQQIIKKEEKLESEQAALAELLINMHFESDAEPIMILVGANSISDLAEKTAREEVIKEQISVAAKKVKEEKLVLEQEKAKVEELLESLEEAKTALAAQKREQQELVAKYANDAAAYEAVAETARNEAQAAILKYQQEHPESYNGNVFAGAYNSYPWQNECPGRQDAYITYWTNDYTGETYKIGGYVCECVSYAGWKAYEAYGVAPAWGNAYDWDTGARNAGYLVDNNPAPDTIGQQDGWPYGHVFWVESVNSDGSINVTEYNNYYATALYYLGTSYGGWVGDFGSRVIPANQTWQYNYIHF